MRSQTKTTLNLSITTEKMYYLRTTTNILPFDHVTLKLLEVLSATHVTEYANQRGKVMKGKK